MRKLLLTDHEISMAVLNLRNAVVQWQREAAEAETDQERDTYNFIAATLTTIINKLKAAE